MKLCKILVFCLFALLLNSSCKSKKPNIDGFWLGNFDADDFEDLVKIKNDTIHILSTYNSGVIKYPFSIVAEETILIDNFEMNYKVDNENFLSFYSEGTIDTFHYMKEEVYSVFYNRYIDYYNQSFDEMPAIEDESF